MCYQTIQTKSVEKDDKRYTKALLANKTCLDCRFRFEYPLCDKVACQLEGKITWTECMDYEIANIGTIPGGKFIEFTRRRFMKDFNICEWFDEDV